MREVAVFRLWLWIKYADGNSLKAKTWTTDSQHSSSTANTNTMPRPQGAPSSSFRLYLRPLFDWWRNMIAKNIFTVYTMLHTVQHHLRSLQLISGVGTWWICWTWNSNSLKISYIITMRDGKCFRKKTKDGENELEHGTRARRCGPKTKCFSDRSTISNTCDPHICILGGVKNGTALVDAEKKRTPQGFPSLKCVLYISKKLPSLLCSMAAICSLSHVHFIPTVPSSIF